jgi:outer membrane protein assembly factor BamB
MAFKRNNGLLHQKRTSGGVMNIRKGVRVVIIIVVLLLIMLSFIIFSTFLPTSDNTAYSRHSLQYEWPQFQGDSSFTRFSAGPAPEVADILWKTNISNIRSYISAFNGKVFVIGNTTVFAIDRETGSIIWNTTVPTPGSWPTVYKIDDAHMVVGNSCLHPDTGRILWTSANFSAAPQPLFSYNVYSPEEKMFYLKESSYVQAWDFSDPSIPPTLAWETFVSGSGSVGSGVQYGDGKVFSGSYEPHQMALDAKTGAVLWDAETTGPMLFSGTYSNGKFFRGGTHDNTFYAFDATNGTVVWTFNPGTSDGYWCVGSAAAYGMVYELNKDGNLYALDENTGDVVWHYKGPGPLLFPGTPTVADGKIYATTGQAAQYFGLQSESEFACLDAYTGRLIWKLPMEAFAPRESVAIAYGNLYLIPGDVTTAVDSISGNEYLTLGQVWAIGSDPWAMWRKDPAHSAIGQSGPVNLSLRWKFTAGGAVVSSPSAAYGMIYFGSQDKKVYCVDARSGEFVWNFNTGARIKSSPAVVDGKVYIGPDDGNVYCLDAYNGHLIWMKPAGGYIPANFEASVILSSSPAVVGDRVYVGSLDTNLYCLNAKNGGIDWKYKTEGYITSSPAVVDGAVYIVSQEPESGALYKLDVDTGRLIWKTPLQYNFMYQEGTDMHASPTVADGMVFASSNIKEYYGINATTGDIEWTYRDDSAVEFIICSTIYKDGKLFLIDKFSIVCVDATNGHPIWESFIGDELYVSPSYADDKLYIVTDQRHIYVLNATNGEKLGWFETSSSSWSAPTIYEGRVYVGNNDWNVYCLAEYPALNSNVTIEVANTKIILGESVTGRGHLVPGMANASVMLIFVRPKRARQLQPLKKATSTSPILLT